MIGDELQRLNARAEAENHIVELQDWLRHHQPNSGWTPSMHQARKDRELSLERWLEKAALCTQGGAR